MVRKKKKIEIINQAVRDLKEKLEAAPADINKVYLLSKTPGVDDYVYGGERGEEHYPSLEAFKSVKGITDESKSKLLIIRSASEDPALEHRNTNIQ